MFPHYAPRDMAEAFLLSHDFTETAIGVWQGLTGTVVHVVPYLGPVVLVQEVTK